MSLFKTINSLKKLNRIFCRGMVCKTHAGRDAIVILIAIALSAGLIIYSRKPASQKNVPESFAQIAPQTEQEFVEEEEKNVAQIVSNIDTSAWTPYQNTWYGFALKYPENWADPIAKKPVAGTNWEQQIQFRMKQADENNPFIGFDVVIYSIAKIKQATNTEEYPKLKNAELISDPGCATIDGHLLETGDYPAEEIYIPANDACYNAVLYFSNTRDAYIYNLVPRMKDGAGFAGDPAQEIASHMPEFISAASKLNFIDIVRPKPVLPKPRITAPMPYVFKVDSLGRKVCNKKNDKPSKSKKYNHRHMDMECCLDPDEDPNPNCYYDPGKYGKYL